MSILTDEMSDDEMIAMALTMWANRIETGNPDLSVNDAVAMRREVNPLPDDAKARVLRLRELVAKRSTHSEAVMAQFHRLWGLAEDSDYEKKEWQEMQRLLNAYLRR